MTITITGDETRETRYYVREIELDGVAPVLLERRYSHGGKEFLPDFAYARWDHGGGIKVIELHGYVLKKDRSTGQQRASLKYGTPNSLYWGRDSVYPDAPAWLLELFGIEDVPTEEMGQ